MFFNGLCSSELTSVAFAVEAEYFTSEVKS